MAYWRMQLHPSRPEEAVKYAATSLAARFVGLDFDVDVGDLLRADPAALPEKHRDYLAFAREMAIEDHVLVIAHHFPFAICRIAGDYNYVRSVEPELDIWFRHLRRVKDVRFYADFVTNAQSWEQIKMTDAISPLRDPSSLSYRLIERWRVAA